MYKAFADDDNKLFLINLKDGAIEKSTTKQTGEFEKDILCLSCDNEKIGKLETYANSILYGNSCDKILENRRSNDGVKCTYCAEIDYQKFKLFLLSLLWRSSISKRSLFKNVDLGPHEDILKNMLLNNDPGTPLDYPCIIMTYLNSSNIPSGMIVQPTQLRINKGFIYSFIIGGLIYNFFISKHIIRSDLDEIVINTKNEMKIIHVKREFGSLMLEKFIGFKF